MVRRVSYQELIRPFDLGTIIKVPFMDWDTPFKVHVRAIPGTMQDELKRKCRPAGSTFQDEVDFRKWCRALVENGIVGWEGLDDEENPGQQVPFSKQAALKLTEDPKVATWLTETILNVENFKGNERPSSDADSTTT